MRNLILLCLLLLSGCNCKVAETEQRIDNIVRIFMHSPKKYTFFQSLPGNKIDSMMYSVDKVDLIADVPTGEAMWAVYRLSRSVSGSSDNLEIHIHSVSEINGGEWSSGGKNPIRGQTTVIE
jgi:hypothetical protein